MLKKDYVDDVLSVPVTRIGNKYIVEAIELVLDTKEHKFYKKLSEIVGGTPEYLEKAMRDETGIYDRDIMYSDVKDIRELSLHERNINDISALGSLTNLTQLDLSENDISDISSLGDLTNLACLYLSSNSISDISALSNLTNLTMLFLGNNNIVYSS